MVVLRLLTDSNVFLFLSLNGIILLCCLKLDCLSVQFSSVAQSCPTFCDPMNRSTPGLPVHHQLPECTQTHVHRVSDAIQPSHPLSSPSPAPNPFHYNYSLHSFSVLWIRHNVKWFFCVVAFHTYNPMKHSYYLSFIDEETEASEV